MANKKSINLFLGLNSTQFQKGLTKAQRRLKRFGSSMKRVGQSMTTSLTVPLVGIGAVAGKTFMDFEQSMLKVKAISGATGEEFKALEENAKALGSSTMFTASQVAGLQLELSKLGLTPGQINQSTGSILNLAQATDSDLSQAAEVAAKTMNAFGLEASDMTRIADVMADSFSSSALDMSKFETAMASVAPVALQAGADIEQTTAILGVLVNNGVEASTAGTALRNIFLDLSKEGKTMGEAMAEIQNSTNPLATSMEMFGKRGATVATILANNGKEIQALNEDFKDSAGEAQKMADIMDSGLGGSLRKLKSELEGIAIEIGQILVPIFRTLIGFIKRGIDAFNSLTTEQKQFGAGIALVVAGMGPFLIIVGKLASALALLATPMSGLVLLFGTVAAAIAHLTVNWDAFVSSVLKSGPTITKVVSFLLKSMVNVAPGLLATAHALDALGDAMESGELDPEDLDKEWGSFGDTLDVVIDKLKQGLSIPFQNGGTGTPDAPEPADILLPMGPEEFDYDSLMPDEEENTFWGKSGEEIQKWAEGAMVNIQKFAATWGESIGKAAAIYSQFIDGQIEKDRQKLEEDLLRLDEQKAIEIQRVENSTMTEEDKAKALLEIETEYETKSEDLKSQQAAKERALKRKQAVAEKIAAIFSIGSSTAMAVMKAVAAFPLTGGMPWSGIATGLGIANIGAVLANPLPPLAQGGLAFGPTAALVGDNPNASVDPEVIAPLSKLQGMMGGMQKVQVEGIIKGEDIWLINNLQTTRQSRLG